MYFKVPFIRNEYDAYVSKKKGGVKKSIDFQIYILLFLNIVIINNIKSM